MNPAAFIRLLVAFVVALVAGYVYESSALADYREREGTVVRVETVPSGHSGDSKRFHISYAIGDSEREFTATRDFLARHTTFEHLARGDDVPILVHSEDANAVLDTPFRRYPFTMCVGALFAIFLGTCVYMAVTRWIPRTS